MANPVLKPRPRTITPHFTLFIQDYDSPDPSDTQTFIINPGPYRLPFGTSKRWDIERSVDEVRVKADVTVFWSGPKVTDPVRAEVNMFLFEGASSSTTDLDGMLQNQEFTLLGKGKTTHAYGSTNPEYSYSVWSIAEYDVNTPLSRRDHAELFIALDEA